MKHFQGFAKYFPAYSTICTSDSCGLYFFCSYTYFIKCAERNRGVMFLFDPNMGGGQCMTSPIYFFSDSSAPDLGIDAEILSDRKSKSKSYFITFRKKLTHQNVQLMTEGEQPGAQSQGKYFWGFPYLLFIVIHQSSKFF